MCLWVLAAGIVVGAEPATAARAMALAREGAAAAEGRDPATSLARLEAAVALRPDLPAILEALAAAQVANQRPDDALVTLERLAALGVGAAIEKSEEFAELRARSDFQALVKKLAANLHPRGKGEVAFALRDVTGLMEGIAWRRKSGDFFFGDVHNQTVWRRNRAGVLTRFSREGAELLGVFGLAVDEGRGALWAATSAVPEMRGYDGTQEGSAALIEIDLESGEVRRTFPVRSRADQPSPPVLRDVAVDANGTVWLIDGGSPAVWRLGDSAEALERFAESAEFLSLQGIAVLPSGVVVVSDRASGLLRLDPATRQVRRIDHAADVTLVGLAGLAATPSGQVFAIQNGQWPNRVLGLELDEAGENVRSVTVVESGHLALSAPTLGCLATDGEFHYVGNSGWMRFASPEARPTPPRSVPVFRSKLASAKP
jgi:sugar lactone lactonase YvrE